MTDHAPPLHVSGKVSRWGHTLAAWKTAFSHPRAWLNSAVTLSLAAFLVVKVWDQSHSWALRLVQPLYLLLAMAGTVAAMLLSAWLWYLFLPEAQRPRFWHLLGLYVNGLFWNNFLPAGVGGDVVRAVSLARHSQRVDQAVGSVFMGRVASLWSVAVLAFSSGLVYGESTAWRAPLLPLIATGGLALTFLATLVMLGMPLPRAAHRFSWLKSLNSLQTFYRHPRRMAQSFLIALGVQMLSVFINACMAAALGLPVSAAQLLFAMPLINLVSTLPVSLGGLGLREGSYYYLLGLVGASPLDAVALSLCVYALIILASAGGAGVLALRSLSLPAHPRLQRVLHLLRGAWRPAGRPALPPDLILYLTDRCNARCGHCFYRTAIDRPASADRLDLAALEKLAASLPRPLHSLVLTGGEPFLRPDLVEICRLFWERCRVEMLFLPTNGLMVERIARMVDAICQSVGSRVYVQISLDGLQDSHDAIRGVPGIFNRALQTARALQGLQSTHPNLYLTFSTTLSQQNVGEMEALADFIYRELGIPHAFELVRGARFEGYTNLSPALNIDHHPANPVMSPLPVGELPALCRRLDRIFRQNAHLVAENAAWLAPFAYAYRSRRFWHLAEVLDHARGFQCPAGNSIGVIYSNGDVAVCEFTRPVGNLLETDFNLSAIWNNAQAAQMRNAIRGCYCTHGCFQAVAMMHEPQTPFLLLKDAAAYLQWRLARRRDGRP